jgi:hypothetical protein
VKLQQNICHLSTDFEMFMNVFACYVTLHSNILFYFVLFILFLHK